MPPTPSAPPTPPLNPSDDNNFAINATAQKQSYLILQKAKSKVYEYNSLFQASTSSELRSQFASKVKKLDNTISLEENKLKKLKNNAAAKQRSREKKKQRLDKENIVEMYDASGQPSFLTNNLTLLEKMRSSVKFEATDHKKRKEIIKVRTIKHLREKMEEDYNIHMAKSILQNYMQPRHPEIREAK